MLWSSEEITNKGVNENTVTVANAITLNHDDAIYMLYFITFVKLVELLSIIYRSINKRMRRRYANNNNNIGL